MRFRKMAVFLLILILSGSGLASCMHSRVRMADAPGDIMLQYQKWFFFGGLLPHRKYEVNDLCPGGSVQEVHQYTGGWDILITVATLGIVVPQRLDVICSRSR